MKILKKKTVLLICFLIMMIVLPVQKTYAKQLHQDKKIKVGCALTVGYHQKDKDGSISGYGYDYEAALAQYAGWEIEYVEGEWNELQLMLQLGKIDMLGFLVENDQRKIMYDFADMPTGTSMSCLVRREDDDRISYESFDEMNLKTVAVLSGNANNSSFTNFCRRHGFSMQMVVYDTYDAIFRALDEGRVDTALLANFHDMSKYSIVAKFAPVNYYYAVTKGNEKLLTELNDAMADLNVYYPNLSTELYNKYYSDQNGKTVMFTREELAYLETNPVVTVVPSGREQPYEYKPKGSRTYQGIVPEILQKVSDTTGIQFVYTDDHDRESYQKYDGNVITSVTADFDWAARLNLDLTQSFAESNIVTITKSADTKIKTLALLHNDYVRYYIEKKYPQWEIKSYNNLPECMEAVVSGQCDATVINSIEADYYLSMGKYQTLNEEVLGNIRQNLGIGVTKGSDTLLYGVLSKALLMISSEDYQTIIKNSTKQSEMSTVADLIYSDPIHFMAIVFVIFSLVVIVFVLTTYAVITYKAKVKVEDAAQAKMDFFARMSHDMRTPMNGILGMAALSEDENDIGVMRHNMEKIRQSGIYMLSLINDTLDLQKIESGKMQLEEMPASVRMFTEDLENMFRATASEKDVKFKFTSVNIDIDNYVVTDVIRLKQIFVNLISNAIKFTDEGGMVEFYMECLGSDGDIHHDRFQIRDTGIGMGKEFVEKNLFTAYSQERNSMTSKYAGSGLGLAITKNLVELMGGTISVESELGEGTIFTINMDIKSLGKDYQSTIHKKSDDWKKLASEKLAGKTILLCEDHPLNAEITMKMLNKFDIKVVWAKDGAQGYRLFKDSEEYAIDAILMDIQMPVMNGHEAAIAIRSLERADAKIIPILAMTANAYEEDKKRSREAGMNEHLAKPVNPQQLCEALMRFL